MGSSYVRKSMILNRPWIIIGNYNEVRFANERVRVSQQDNAAMVEFNDCLERLDLEELHGWGAFFTWCNKRDHGVRIYSKIGKAFVNEQWFNAYPQVDVELFALLFMIIPLLK